ncbi:cysteine--tRNA ligase [Porticoccus litoralis]|uniref:Cysteine--tRNA ligase n=1 Tax=Porticoccus litoralis TaxID=434086 RepID=A0AAW8AXY4_9GAMM|nr:cysteine--tRNA ligase [Porticoccus litoralis]MDP1519816.1 cysteine--tRNA ligase [Porticoccus litoralis]
MALTLYNTLTRQKEVYKPIEAGKIRMYVCGITVYDYCHIGHARVMVSFDVITRYLRSQGWDVTYVRNITDVDDKILNRAIENGESFTDLTDRMIDAMHEDEDALGVLRPDIEPRATGHMDDILDMVQILVDNHYAYVADNGDVYYRISRFPEYGKLSNKNPEDLLAGARVEVGDIKEDPRDFALWKSAKPGEVSWDSPWGPGRPGWHIECSAMSICCLGETFDIHGGGPDLPFPHHENEIAQSEAATGKQYVNYWMHAGAVRVDDEKMSKSLGNFFTIREVLKKYHPEVVRYFLLSSHYRSPINYSEENLIEAKGGLERFYTALRPFADVQPVALDTLKDSDYYQRFVTAMDDDFNTREALAAMYDLVRDINTQAKTDEARARQLVAELKAMAGIFGILDADPEAFLQGGGEGDLDAAQIEALIVERADAKKNRDFARADQIREDLLAQGVVLEDSREGTTWRRE